MSRHIHDHRKTKAVQPARIAKTLAITTADVHEVQTRDQDRHGTITDAAAIAKANHTAPGVQHIEIDKTIESEIPNLLYTVAIQTARNLPPPTTTTPPTPQTPTPKTP